jgi:hypothetical protein
MKTIAILIVVVAAVSGQRGYVDPKNAAILAEARYLSGDGSFGAAYVQEDNTEFKEETAQDGERKGQYSYVDPNGKKITVHYTAGKNGFQVSGDHLPKAPAPPPGVPAYQAPRAPAAPQYNSQPQYNSIPQNRNYAGGRDPEDGQYRAELHELPYQYSDGQQYAPAQQSRPAPPPQQQNFNQGFNYQQQTGFSNNYQQPQNNYQQTTTTPQPKRFFPPGKLDLNRTPEGFNFQFQSRQ